MAQAFRPKDVAPWPTTPLQVAGLCCAYCLKPGNDNKRMKCSGCRWIFYCGPDCQKKDWKDHKARCELLKQINTVASVSMPQRFPGKELYGLRNKLGHTVLTGKEFGSHPIITHQIKCAVCFYSPYVESVNFKDFAPCPRCELAWTCSPHCKTEFDKFHHTPSQCDALFDSLITARFQIAHSIDAQRDKILASYNPFRRQSYKPISSVSSWEEYESAFSGAPFYYVVLKRIASQHTNTGNKDVNRAVLLHARRSLAFAINILSALELGVSDLATKTKICIHFVAVTADHELRSLQMLEEVLHHLPRLKDLCICLIGPGLARFISEEREDKFGACKACCEQGVSVSIIGSPRRYHDFIGGANGKAHHPDLIIGFHTGLHMTDPGVQESWRPSMRSIISLNVPAYFTCWADGEPEKEIAAWKEEGGNVSRNFERNVWYDPIPTPNDYGFPRGLEHIGMYPYKFWYMIKGSQN